MRLDHIFCNGGSDLKTFLQSTTKLKHPLRLAALFATTLNPAFFKALWGSMRANFSSEIQL
jgi:hypothetical protein